MHILIVGDSFAADWTCKYPDGIGWPNLLANDHTVTNLAMAGVGEYKILQQVESIKDSLDVFDFVVISHTSPYRVNTRRHPVHYSDPLHKNADLSMNDIDYHSSKLKSWLNLSLRSARRFFIDHFDQAYQEKIFQLLKKEVHRLLQHKRCIVINNFINLPIDTKVNAQYVDCAQIQLEHPGLMNHLSEQGNQKVYKILSKIIDAK